MDHGNSVEKVSTMVSNILAIAARTVETVLEQHDGMVQGGDGPQRLGSTMLAHKIAASKGYPQALCQSVVSAWLAEHPEVTCSRGPSGGITWRKDDVETASADLGLALKAAQVAFKQGKITKAAFDAEKARIDAAKAAAKASLAAKRDAVVLPGLDEE